MKKTTFWRYSLLCFLGSIFSLTAQTSEDKLLKEQRRTLLYKFEPDYVQPASERIALKEKRIAALRKMQEIINDLNISDKKRYKLMRELKQNPFSKRIKKAILAVGNGEDDLGDSTRK